MLGRHAISSAWTATKTPNGPGPRVFDTIRGAFGEANRYPHGSVDELVHAIATSHGVRPENVLLGCGSGEILRVAVQTFTSPTRALVSPSPTFESPSGFAKVIGTPVRSPRVDDALRIDMGAMLAAAKDAGLVFLCNPNNPTATVHGAASVRSFVDEVTRTSLQTVILIDEAYHEYVDDPDYATAVPIALNNPNVIVSRTFSKVFGMAGMRVGYAIGRPETLAKMRPWILGSNINELAAAAASIAIADKQHIAEQQELNRAVRSFTRKFFADAGYEVAGWHANFVMVDIRRDVKAFGATCLKQGVSVGRPFPPLDTYLRVSVGTLPEMEKAADVIRSALA